MSPKAPNYFHRPHTALLTKSLVKKAVRSNHGSSGHNNYNHRLKSTKSFAQRTPNIRGEHLNKVYKDRLSSADFLRTHGNESFVCT